MRRPRFRRSSISTKLIGGFILATVPIVAISVGAVTLALRVTHREVRESHRNSLVTTAGHLGASLSRLRDMTDALAAYDSVHVINQAPEIGATILEYRHLLDRLSFYALINGLDSVLTVHLLGKERSFTSSAGFEVIPRAEQPAMIDGLLAAGGRWVLGDTGAGAARVYLTYGQYVPSPSGRLDIAVTVGVRRAAVYRFLDAIELDKQAGVILFDSAATTVLSTSARIADPEGVLPAMVANGIGDGDVTVRLRGNPYRFLVAVVDDTGLILGMLLPEGVYTAPIRATRRWLFVIAAVSLGLGTAFALYEQRSILLPIRRLTAAMESMRAGTLRQYVEPDRHDEIGVLCRQFNGMVERIRGLVDEVSLEHLKHEQVRFRLLQSQVNPHFLYNCLNLIYRMCRADDADGAAALSLSLGKYYRVVTTADHESITVAEEMDNARAYIQIHAMRYPQRLEYAVSWSDDVARMRIPRLIIQPIVENAVIHGLDNLERSGSVTVRADMSGGSIRIEVEDSGCGIPSDKMHCIVDRMHEPASPDDSIGLSNCFWRLRLKYGDQADVRLEPRLPSGLRVVMRMPTWTE